MGKSKPSYIPKAFESDKPFSGSPDTSANIFRSMMLSDAWQQLTSKQIQLYQCCKSERYGKSKDDLKQFKQFFDEYGIPKGEQRDYFTMNWAKVKKPDGLFKLYTGNQQLIRDMSALIEYGFIDCIICGADARSKSLYKYSDRWRKYGTTDFSIPKNVQTISMSGTRRQEKKRP